MWCVFDTSWLIPDRREAATACLKYTIPILGRTILEIHRPAEGPVAGQRNHRQQPSTQISDNCLLLDERTATSEMQSEHVHIALLEDSVRGEPSPSPCCRDEESCCGLYGPARVRYEGSSRTERK